MFWFCHYINSFVSLYWITILRHFPLAIAWVRHADRRLFLKFPEVVFMDFTANTTKVSFSLNPWPTTSHFHCFIFGITSLTSTETFPDSIFHYLHILFIHTFYTITGKTTAVPICLQNQFWFQLLLSQLILSDLIFCRNLTYICQVQALLPFEPMSPTSRRGCVTFFHE